MPEEINYSALRFFWDVVQSLALLGLFVWTVIDRRRQKNSDGISNLVKRMQSLDLRVQRLEDVQSLMPSHQDLSDVKKEVEGLNQKIEAQNNLLQTIHKFLLTNKGKES